jgi:hypothetical protein
VKAGERKENKRGYKRHAGKREECWRRKLHCEAGGGGENDTGENHIKKRGSHSRKKKWKQEQKKVWVLQDGKVKTITKEKTKNKRGHTENGKKRRRGFTIVMKY